MMNKTGKKTRPAGIRKTNATALRISAAVAMLMLASLLAQPFASALHVQRDVGNHELANGPNCTATNQDSGDILYASVNDAVRWYIDISGQTNYDGILHSWFNLTISRGVENEFVFGDNKYSGTMVRSGVPIASFQIAVEWTPDQADLYTVEWNSKLRFVVTGEFPICEDTMSGGHSLSVT